MSLFLPLKVSFNLQFGSQTLTFWYLLLSKLYLLIVFWEKPGPTVASDLCSWLEGVEYDEVFWVLWVFFFHSNVECQFWMKLFSSRVCTYSVSDVWIRRHFSLYEMWWFQFYYWSMMAVKLTIKDQIQRIHKRTDTNCLCFHTINLCTLLCNTPWPIGRTICSSHLYPQGAVGDWHSNA